MYKSGIRSPCITFTGALHTAYTSFQVSHFGVILFSITQVTEINLNLMLDVRRKEK